MFGIEHGVVDVNVDDLGPGLDLAAGDVEGGFVFLFANQPGELGRPGDVGAFADVDEAGDIINGQRLQPA